MGGAKQEMMEHEDNLAAATAYLVSKKILKQCDFHDTVFGGGWDIDPDFWRYAMADRNRGNDGPVPWAQELGGREYTDLLKEAYDEHSSDSCSYCDKIMAE